MISNGSVQDFLSQKSVAVIGVSRKKNKFGYTSYSHLKGLGYKTFPVNPNTDEIDGDKCYADLKSIPEKVDWILTVVPPAATEKIINEAADAGINKIWMQTGSESERAIELCRMNNMSFVSKECIMMFAEPKGFHNFHRIIWKLLGKLPAS